MEDNMFTESSTREELYRKLRENFDGKIVRKDLTKRIKEGANAWEIFIGVVGLVGEALSSISSIMEAGRCRTGQEDSV